MGSLTAAQGRPDGRGILGRVQPPADVAARARSLRAAIAALVRRLRQRIGPDAPAPRAARRRGEAVDPFELGPLDADGSLLALRICRLQGDLAALRDGARDRCGARRRDGLPCGAAPVKGRARCKLHGGRSTGPKTAEGRARCRAAAIALRRGVPLGVPFEPPAPAP